MSVVISTTFNPVTYQKKLKDAGMEARVAEVQAEEMSNFVNNTLVTKDDLRKELDMLEMRIQGFMVKALIVAVTMMATIQGIVGHFMK